MKKVISIILLLAMMLTICACGNNGTTGDVPTGNNDNNESRSNNSTNESPKPGDIIDAGTMILTEMGTVPDGVNFTSGGIITKSDGEKIQVLNQNGVSFNDKWYDDVDSIISNGICIVSNADTSGKELLGIVDSISEKELVPCEAVEVVKLSDRFIPLGYETGKAGDDDKFGFYSINFEIVNYKGYGEILAAEGNVREQTGSLVLIESTLYDVVSGKAVLTDVDSCVATGGNLYVWDNEKETYTRYIAEFKSEG